MQPDISESEKRSIRFEVLKIVAQYWSNFTTHSIMVTSSKIADWVISGEIDDDEA